MSVECSLIARSDSIADLDRFAWDAICNWSHHTCACTIYNGLDYAELTRCFLWDKVARAIRKQTYPEQFEYEQAILDRRPPSILPDPHPNRLKFWLKRSLKSLQTWQDIRSLQSSRVLYVPHAHPTLQIIVSNLARSMQVVAHQGAFDRISELRTIHPPLIGDLPNFVQVDELHRGILEGLQTFGIDLIAEDAIVLRHQIAQLFLRNEQIERELSMLRPAAILVFADNHFPVQSYVFAARKRGIKTIMLQHGLDCERYCLDQAYADIISVWGEARLQRYQTDSTWQPQLIQANGNPEYDRLSLPKQLDLTGDYWLWATRPHRPEKCLSPSRTPQEGAEILAALLTALQHAPTAHLVIKPHPLDDLDQYQAGIEAQGLGDRVTLSIESIQSLLTKAQVVISEDSTVSLEAMFFGKVVVHAHFARSAPVLPLAQFNAGLPGYSPEQLHHALQHVYQFTDEQQQQLLTGQRHFLQAYAGLCDGQAQERVTSLVQRALEP